MRELRAIGNAMGAGIVRLVALRPSASTTFPVPAVEGEVRCFIFEATHVESSGTWPAALAARLTPQGAIMTESAPRVLRAACRRGGRRW